MDLGATPTGYTYCAGSTVAKSNPMSRPQVCIGAALQQCGGMVQPLPALNVAKGATRMEESVQQSSSQWAALCVLANVLLG